MKLTIQKIFLSILALAISVAGAIIGMYMVFLAEMVFQYRLLFAAVFMFNPILTGFLIAYMFKKAAQKEPKKPKDSELKDERETGEAAYLLTQSQTAHAASPAAYQAQPETSLPESYGESASAADDFSVSASATGYDLPGSEVYTDYENTVNPEDGAMTGTSGTDDAKAETSTAEKKSKLKFWEKK